MSKKAHVRGSDLRGYGRLAIDATLGLTSLVETMHHNILRMPAPLGKSTQAPARGITGFVYKSIRGVTRLVGGGLDALLGQLTPLLDRGASSPEREAILAALNGVLGDHLADNDNPLAIPMRWRRDGHALELTSGSLAKTMPRPTGKILVLVHGLCMSDLQWRRHGHDHGAALAAETGFTPLYLHYNTGTHISSNGRAFAEQMQSLLHAWPVSVEEVVILGHSMGGLVTRSACHHAEEAGQTWLRRLSKIIFLGTPHHGAPLERGGNWIDAILDASPYTTAFARLGKVRSAGITDLRHGNLSDEDWQQRDRFKPSRRKPLAVALPQNVACYAIAASLARKTGELRETLLGDGLVPLNSALGQSGDAKRDLALPKSRQWIGYGMNHLDLLDSRQVYERIRKWL
jgi:pimeloyl-ACP methyl ester carboxylesterase